YFTWAGTIAMLFFVPALFDTLQNATLEANLAAIYFGIFPAGLSYATWAIALSIGNVSTFFSMLSLASPIAVLVACVRLREIPSVLSMIGGFIAISSVAVVKFIGRKQQKIPSMN